MSKFVFFLLIYIVILQSCQMNDSMTITIKEQKDFSLVPSASGIEHLKHKFWIIGDDSPWLYELDEKINFINKHVIFSLDKLKNGVLPKEFKHDFEAMTAIKWEGDTALFIFGSGSDPKSTTRNSGVLVELKNKPIIRSFDLTKLYQLVMQKAKLKENDLNIEAAVILEDKLYLFNRGKNRMVSLKVSDFQDFILGKTEKIKMKALTIDLPEIDGIRAGFSGATADEKYRRIIFTASVENTSDWIKDGEVLGSFIGIIEIDDIHQHYNPKCVLIADNEEAIKIKAESITLTYAEKKSINFIVVTDSDGGKSEMLKLEIDL